MSRLEFIGLMNNSIAKEIDREKINYYNQLCKSGYKSSVPLREVLSMFKGLDTFYGGVHEQRSNILFILNSILQLDCSFYLKRGR